MSGRSPPNPRADPQNESAAWKREHHPLPLQANLQFESSQYSLFSPANPLERGLIYDSARSPRGTGPTRANKGLRGLTRATWATAPRVHAVTCDRTYGPQTGRYTIWQRRIYASLPIRGTSSAPSSRAAEPESPRHEPGLRVGATPLRLRDTTEGNSPETTPHAKPVRPARPSR